MKKRHMINLFLPLLFIQGLSSCKKDDPIQIIVHAIAIPEYDFRDALTGRYAGTMQVSTYWMGHPPVDTSYTDTVAVYKYSANDSMIIFGAPVKVDSTDGSFSVSNWDNYFGGTVKNGMLEFNTHSGGLGGGTQMHFTGSRF